MNEVTFKIDNCLKCNNCYTAPILTADSFEHEEGAYCKLVKDPSFDGFGKNGEHKLIGSDDWHLENYTHIPDWCPLLNKPKESPKPKKLEGLHFSALLWYISPITGDKALCSFMHDAKDNPDEDAMIMFMGEDKVTRVRHADLRWYKGE